jgi:hypothetical protein
MLLPDPSANPGRSRTSRSELRFAILAFAALFFCWVSALDAQTLRIAGTVTDPARRPVPNASIDLLHPPDPATTVTSDAAGRFEIHPPALGSYQLIARSGGLRSPARVVQITPARLELLSLRIALVITETDTVSVTSTATAADLASPDPAEKVFLREDLVDANPGRPGAPASVPGYPVETASGGIKAPQYFAPGVAGDHGAPIAQFIAIGSYLVPNNLSANAHGNGYADPNLLIPQALSYVQIDGGSFNVLEGNHSVNLAAAYGLRDTLQPLAALTGDPRNLDAVFAWPASRHGFLALEANYGNGYLSRLEHRQQYKFNAQRLIDAGPHRITLAGFAYYASSYLPGLMPTDSQAALGPLYRNWGDTIDPHQREQTHTTLFAANDVWTPTRSQKLQFSGFFRTYNLSLYSDFGAGLIRQSEFRTVAGANAQYLAELPGSLSLLAGLDFQREAPRNDNLDHYGFYAPDNPADGVPTPVGSSNVTITPIAPYAALERRFGSHLQVYGGWRHDQIAFNNDDLLNPANSFHHWTGVDSPKATVSLLPGSSKWIPLVSLSAGQSFFTEDPRIGNGSAPGTPVSRAHAYQFVASKPLGRAEFKIELGQTTTGSQLAKIEADTGLQEDQGPGRVRFATASVRTSFRRGSLLATFSKADARDLDTGQPTAEAPRTIAGLLARWELPRHFEAKSEYEYVAAKPLGTGCAPDPAAQCIGVPVSEFRAALARAFQEGRLTLGVNFAFNSGYTGQTLEQFALTPALQPTGVRLPSYASASVTYRFSGKATQ